MADFTDDFSTYAVSKLPTFREKFRYSTKALADADWVSQDEPDNQVDVINENFFYTVKRDGSNSSSSIDLGTGNVSDIKWTLRCKLTVDTPYTVTSSLSSGFTFGLEDTDSSAGLGFLNNFLKITLINTIIGGGSQHQNTSLLDGVTANGVEGTTTGWTAGDTRYLELKRLSRTEFQTTIYSDAKYSVIIDRITKPIPAGITGLRYIKIGGPRDNEPTYNGVFTGTVDDIEFWGEKTTPEFRDRFDMGDNWLDTGAGWGVNTLNETLDCTFQHNGADNHTSFDLQTILGETVDDEKWVLRFKVNITSLVKGTSTVVSFGITDTEAGGALGIAQDSVTGCIDLQNSVTEGYGLGNTSGDNAVLPIQAFLASKIVVAIATATDYFVELKRLSATEASMRVFTDETYTTPLAGLSQRTILSTSGQNIRYIKFFERENSFAGDLTYEVDDMEFFNGISSVTTEGAQQGDQTFEDDFVLKTATLTDDFATDNFTDVGVGVGVGTNVLDFTSGSLSAENGSYFDLVSTSDTNWALRFKFRFSTLTDGAPSANLYVGMSDNNVIMGGESNQDMIGLNVVFQSVNKSMHVFDVDGAFVPKGGGDIDLTTTPAISTDYFCEIIRTSATTYSATLYSDSTFTTIIGSGTGTCPATITGLRYLKVAEFSSVGGALMTGTIDDVQFYNGTSILTDWLGATGNDVNLNTTNCRIDFDIPQGVQRDELLVHDLQSSIGQNADEENWTLRFKIDTDAINQGTSEQSASLFVGLDDGLLPANTVGHDYITFGVVIDQGGAGPQFGAVSTLRIGDNASFFSGASGSNFPIMWATGTLYIEVKRLSSILAECTLYSDASFTEVFSTPQQVTIASTLDNLRYIRITTDSSAVANDTDWDGAIDDIEFYNCVSVSKTPLFVPKDFEDNFWEDNFTDTGTGVGVNTGTQVIDWDSVIDGANNSSVFDLGVGNVSDVSWTLRFKYTTSSLSVGSSTGKYFWIGLSDVDDTVDSETAQDFISFFFFTALGGTTYDVMGGDGVTLSSLSNRVSFTTTPTASDVYFVELKRTSATTVECKLFSDSDYAILVDSVTTTIPSTVIGLRYISLKNRTLPAETGGMTGTVDDVKFWNASEGIIHKNTWKEVN